MAPDPMFESTQDSILPDALELVLSEGQGSSEKSVILLVELIVGSGRFTTPEFTAYLDIQEGYLAVSSQGGKIQHGSRLGEHDRATIEIVDTQVVRSTDLETTGAIGAQVKVSNSPTASAELQGKIRAEAKESRKTVQTETNKQHRVQALPGGTWHIREIQDGPLSGRYLGQDPLCRIVANDGIVSIDARFSVQKRALVLTEIHRNGDGKREVLSLRKKKVLEALYKKALHHDGDRITIATAQMVFREH